MPYKNKVPIINEVKKPRRDMSAKEMVSTYDILAALHNEGALMLLVNKGIVPITFLDYKSIYECYLKHRESKGKMQSYEHTSVDMGVCSRTVSFVVKEMES